MRPMSVGAVAILCLSFTLAVAPRPGWADDSRSPHRIQGAALRGGSIVGHTTFAGTEYVTLGGAIAAGGRYRRITGELEYDYLTLQSDAPSSVILGEGHRIAANARLDVLRLGRRWIGDNSLILVWTELGAGRQWTTWRAPDLERRRGDQDKVLVQRMNTLRARPSRVDSSLGVGWLLDHRSPHARGFPLRVGWLMGWRVTRSPAIADDTKAACVVAGCPSTRARRAEHGMVVHSSLLLTW